MKEHLENQEPNRTEQSFLPIIPELPKKTDSAEMTSPIQSNATHSIQSELSSCESTWATVDILARWFLFGMILLFLTAHWEAKQLNKIPWSQGIVLWNKEVVQHFIAGFPELLDTQRILVIPRITIHIDSIEKKVAQFINQIELGTESNVPDMQFPAFVWLESINEFLPILATGRLPQPGKAEALAGDLAPNQPFQIGDTTFHIVGTIKKECAPFVGGYVIPYESFLQIKDKVDFNLGIFFRNREELYSRIQSIREKRGIDLDYSKEVSGLTARTATLFVWTSLVGVFIVCYSLKNLLYRFYLRLALPPTPILGPLFNEIYQRQNGFRFINGFFYAVFFVNMILALFNPEAYRVITFYINQVFSEGSLQYIGDAYQQGKIFNAALATFYNNFWVQTFILTILISVPPFLLGVIKTLISFAFAGFAMAPIWAGSAIRLTFHTITIVLELEAYILAVFAVLLWTYYFWSGLWKGKERIKTVIHGFRILISATIASGCMLAIAGWYEAVTIIFFAGM